MAPCNAKNAGRDLPQAKNYFDTRKDAALNSKNETLKLEVKKGNGFAILAADSLKKRILSTVITFTVTGIRQKFGVLMYTRCSHTTKRPKESL